MSFARNIWQNLPTLLLAFTMAIVVWIFAVSSSDPVDEHTYPKLIPVEVKGLDPELMITSDIPDEISVTLKAPLSTWEQLDRDEGLIRAYLDLTELEEGTFTPKLDVKVAVEPVEIISVAPSSFMVTLQKLQTETFSIRLIRKGEPAVGYQAEVPKLSQTTAEISGPKAQVEQVAGVTATLDLNNTDTDINQTIALQAVDDNELVIEDVEINPQQIIVSQSINQLGGYRNLAVKVVVKGQISVGYRLTSISAFPAAVTVFSSNPDDVNNLPGYVETESIDVSGIKDDLDVQVPLSLPSNVSVVGDDTVQVQVGVAAIEGSMTWDNMAVDITGLGDGLKATTSPLTVDVIISGPLPTLDSLTDADVRVYVDLTDKTAGTYQKVPRVDLAVSDLRITSILPESIEVTIQEDDTQTKNSTPEALDGSGTPNNTEITVSATPDLSSPEIEMTITPEEETEQTYEQNTPETVLTSDADNENQNNE